MSFILKNAANFYTKTNLLLKQIFVLPNLFKEFINTFIFSFDVKSHSQFICHPAKVAEKHTA